MAQKRGVLSILIGALAAAPAGAQDFSLDVAGELRAFPKEGQFAGQLEHFQPSLAFSPEIKWETEDRRRQIVIEGFFRLDSQDPRRTHGDLREAFVRFNEDDWSFTLGLAKVFWGRAESRHLIDIVNQSDTVEDIDEEDKFGQPMAHLSLRRPFGTIDLFVMSGFRDRTFSGRDGRFRFDFPIDTDTPIFTREARRAAPDFAARYSHYIGAWDFGLAAFFGTSREPRLAIDAAAARILPVYEEIFQASADFQYTTGAWLWKFEGLFRDGARDDFFAAVGGFEYTFYQAFGQADLGLIGEYNFDGRSDAIILESFADAPSPAPLPTLASPFTVFDNDAFLGARLGFNDPQDSSALVGFSVDTQTASMALFAESSRRIGSDWTIEAEARLFFNADPDDVAFTLRDDDLITLRLTRYF